MRKPDYWNSPFDHESCLQYDPWYGDDTYYKLFRDKILITKKEHVCNHCGCTIPSGQTVRSRAEAFEGTAKTFFFCTSCCVAMAISWHDDGKYLTYRTSLHRLREESASA